MFPLNQPYASLPSGNRGRIQLHINFRRIRIEDDSAPDIAQNLIDDHAPRGINRAITNENGKRDFPALGNRTLGDRQSEKLDLLLSPGDDSRSFIQRADVMPDHFYVSFGIKSRVVVTGTRIQTDVQRELLRRLSGLKRSHRSVSRSPGVSILR